MSKYHIHAAKTHFSKLLQKVEAGEEVLICRNDRPVARIVPHTASVKPPKLGVLKGAFAFDKAAFDAADAEIAELFGT